MQIVDLFSGIGGFSLAGHWLGWRTIQFCDINQFGQKVVEYHFPGVPFSTDIKTLTGESIKNNGLYDPNETSLMVGGFPCQPYSMAGKREGTDDARHLWPECIRLVREFRPDFCVWENVPGLINWSGGLVFEQVCADLEGEGYEVQPVVLPASGVNAPHRRDRVWFVASRYGWPINSKSDSRGNSEIIGQNRQRQISGSIDGIIYFERPTQNPNENGRGGDERKEESSIWRFGDISSGDNERLRTDHAEIGVDGNSESKRLERRNGATKSKRPEPGCEEINADTGSARFKERNTPDLAARSGYSAGRNPTNWTDWPTVAPLCTGNDGLSSRLDGITFPKWRNESIKAGGNAIVPQVALQIFKVIEQMRHGQG